MVPQALRPGFVTLRRLLTAGAVIAAGLGVGAMPAGAASSGLSIDSVSVGVGSGVVSQTISIASGSPIVGSSGEIDIWGTEGATYIRGISASASTRASCRSGVSVGVAGLTWGFTCTPSSAGWGAGSLWLRVDSGSSSSPGVCAAISCGFSTTAGWVGPGGPQVSGAVEFTNEADLSVTLNNQAPANSINIWAHSNGPSWVSRAVITLTGLGNYTVSNVDGQCTQAGSTLTCTSQLGSGANMPMQPVFSGGSGPLSLHASIAGYFQTMQNQLVSMPDPNSGNNASNLTWMPGAGSSGGGGGSGSGGGKSSGGAASASPSAETSASAGASASASASALASSSGSASAASPSATLGTGSTPLEVAPVAHSTGSSLSPLLVVLGVLLVIAVGGGGVVLLLKRRTE